MSFQKSIKVSSISLFLILVSLIYSCGTTKSASYITGGEYDQNTNETIYFVHPIGSAKMPGNWKKVRYNSISHQQFFINQDSIELAIAFNEYDKYEFNLNGEQKSYDFVLAFYKWETDYFNNRFGLDNEVIESDPEQKFVIFRVFGKTNEGENIDTFLLFGEKNGNASNFAISKTHKWTAEEKIEFLKELFLAH